MRSRTLIATSLMALLGATACTSGVRQALGTEKTTPDEFRVVTIAPLTVPPEYNLRPPRPGELRAEDVFVDQQAQRALFGNVSDGTATDAEILFASRAGAAQANPSIRELIDGETAAVVRKRSGFADRVLFWQNDTYTPPADRPDALDPEAAQAQIDSVTGGGQVEIERRRENRRKLPGL